MKNNVSVITSQTAHIHSAGRTLQSAAGTSPAISARKLAQLNFGIFRTLLDLGTEQDRICAALGLNSREYEYLVQLG